MGTVYRNFRSPRLPDVTTTRVRTTPKRNWIAKFAMVLAPLVIVVALVASFWMPEMLGIPTVVLGSAASLLVLALIPWNTRLDHDY